MRSRTLILAALALLTLVGCGGGKVVLVSPGQPIGASSAFTLTDPFVYDETGAWVKQSGKVELPAGSIVVSPRSPATRPSK